MLRNRFSMILTLALGICLSTGCARRAGGSGGDDDDDDDDNAELGLAGLDRDSDGELTDGDLDSGEAGVYWLRVVDGDEEGATEEGHTDSDAALVLGDGVWGVTFTTGGESGLTVILFFEDPEPSSFELDPGTGALSWVTVSSDREDELVWVSESGGDITITEVGEGTASGFFEGAVELTFADQFEKPTGEVLRIEGFAFNDLAMPAM